MGEISEALRRAREGTRKEPAASSALVSPRRDAAPTLVAPPRDSAATQRISERAEGAWVARAVLVEPRGEIAEAYRHFAIRLQRIAHERDARSIVVTSAARGEGKTTTACNLALALTSISSGRRVAFLELDVRRPCAANQLGLVSRVGIERVLEGNASLADACLHTQIPELDLYLAARPSANPLAAIASASTGKLLREIARQYDLVVIDSPPVLPVPDVPLVLPHVDAVLLVARNGVSRRAALREALEMLAGEKLVGVFLNEGRTPRHRRYYGYYGDAAHEAESEAAAAGEGKTP